LHGVALLTVDIDTDFALVAAVNPGSPVMHDVVIVLKAVIAALAETCADAAYIRVGQKSGISRRGWEIPAGWVGASAIPITDLPVEEARFVSDGR